MSEVKTNLFTEKIISVMRKGDSHAHRHSQVITIHENKIRVLVNSDSYLSQLAEEQQDDLETMHATASKAYANEQAKEDAARRERQRQVAEARAAEKLAAKLAREQKLREKFGNKKTAGKIADKKLATAAKVFAKSK